MQSRTCSTAPFRGSTRPLTFSRVVSARPGARINRAVVAQATSTIGVRQFLSRMSSLGRCRFIVLGDGAILESVADFTQCAYTDIPNKGTLATVSSPDKSFECHIYLHKVAQAKIARSKAKTGDYELYATRFVDADGKVLMSCLLHGKQGAYEPAAVSAWEALHQEFGDVVTFTA